MVPKLAAIVADCYDKSEILKSLRKHDFILFAKPEDTDYQDGVSLIYGYALAKSLYDNVSIGDYYINDHTRWTFNEFESKDDNYVEEWISTALNEFFKHTPVVGKYGDALWNQLSEIDIVFIYNGNHKLYIYDSGYQNCYSWTHDEIRYRLDIQPEVFAVQICNWFFDNKIAVYAWDPFNLKTIDYKFNGVVIFARDLTMAAQNIWLEKSDLKSMIGSHRKITTPEFLKYVTHLPDVYSKVEQKDYICRYIAGEVEQLYSNADIYFSRDKLLAAIKLRNKSGIDAKPLEKIYTALNSSGMVRVPYISRNKVTGRMFPSGGVLNPITLSDKSTMSTITSRFSGAIVAFDFTAFEPTIIANVLNIEITPQIHDRASEILQAPRDVAKKLNNMIFYGASPRAIELEMEHNSIGFEVGDQYLLMMKPITDQIQLLELELKIQFKTSGFIHNIFGRIVRPKSAASVFNNYIQSSAAEIFNEASSKVFELLDPMESCLFMHKFDALYVDVHPKETTIIEEIVDIMSNKLSINFKVKVLAGKDLSNLRDLN